MWRLFLLFTLVPAVELFVLLKLGQTFGALNTFWLIILTGILGSWLAKREGLSVLTALKDEAQQGLPAGSKIAEGALVFVGGILLITPGIFTDLAGFSFIFPFTRKRLAPLLVEAFRSKIGSAPEQQDPKTPSQNNDTKPTPFSNPFDDL